MVAKPFGTMNPIDPTKGLHIIKSAFQKTYMGEQCDELLARLDEAINSTLRLAPVRAKLRYLVNHEDATKEPMHLEAKLERELHKQWRVDVECDPVAGCWHRLAAFQVSLPDEQDARGWGEIDLLGVTDKGYPVVVELKQGDASDPPAAVLVQACAYGLALQKAWPIFRDEWLVFLAERLKLHPVLPTALHPCPIVCVAPGEYWDEWIGDTARAKTVKAGAWASLGRLAQAFAERGLHVSFARISGKTGSYRVENFTLPA